MVCLAFVFFAMLRQSILAPAPHRQFDLSYYACRGDILVASPAKLLVVRWTKTIQSEGAAPVIPILEVNGHPADLVAAYAELLAASPTSHPNQPLLTIGSGRARKVVTIPMLVSGFRIMLDALNLETALYSLHSL